MSDRHSIIKSSIDLVKRIGECKQCGIVRVKPQNQISKNTGETYMVFLCRNNINAVRRKLFHTDPLKSRRQHLKYNYGLTLKEFEELKLKQDNKCAICKDKLTTCHIDHDHKTKQIRALLCNNCNTGIGLFKENPQKLQQAIEYLKY